jgi:hypothetical protein
MNRLLQPTRPLAATGLAADGGPLADGPAREALRQALHSLSALEAVQGTPHPAVMCLVLTDAARALAGLQAYGPSESYLAQALRWGAMMGGHDLLADLQCAMAEVASNAGDLAQNQGDPLVSRTARERAREHAFEAARLASRVSDPQWEIRVLMRASDVLDRCGDHDDAVLLQQRALVLMGLHDAAADVAPPQAEMANPEDATHTAPGLLM